MHIESAIERFLLERQQAQLVAGDVIVNGGSGKVAAGGALPVARGGLSGALVENEHTLFYMNRRAIKAGQGAEIDISADEYVATVAKAVRPGAGVEVLHRQIPELHMRLDTVTGQLVAQVRQRALAGLRPGLGIQGNRQQKCAQTYWKVHDQLLVFIVVVMSGCFSTAPATGWD